MGSGSTALHMGAMGREVTVSNVHGVAVNGWRWLRYHKDRVTADRRLARGYRRHGIQGWDRVVTDSRALVGWGC